MHTQVGSNPNPLRGRSPENSDGSGRQRRRRRRRRGGDYQGPAGRVSVSPYALDQGPAIVTGERSIVELEGAVRILPEGHGLLVYWRDNYDVRPGAPLVPRRLIQEIGLESGSYVKASAETGHSRGPQLVQVETIDGLTPEAYRQRIRFPELISIDPTEQIVFETEPEEIEVRVLDLLTPIGKGQRCLVVAPPKAGKTVLLQKIAHGVTINHPEVELIVLLVDERPEEVTDMRRSVQGEVVASSSDLPARHHLEVAEFVYDNALRRVEAGRDVMILLDSITRLSRAYNTVQRGSGKTLSGGIDSRTMEKPRRFFGAARNVEGGGSITIIGTALVDTGSRMDEVIFQEFKGTGNTEIVLDRKMFEQRIFPCMDINKSGTRKEEKLYPPVFLPRVHALRRALSKVNPVEAMQLVISKLKTYPTNADFLRALS
jgi:transcription termination factor Rho